MKKQLKFLLFAILMLTLVMMTMIFVSAETTGEEPVEFVPGDGDTQASVETAGGVFDEANYNFKVVDKDGNTVGYYINLGSSVATEAGGAWTAVPDGGKLLILKTVDYSTKTTIWLYNANSFTVDGQGNGLTGKPNLKIHNNVEKSAVAHTIKLYNMTVQSGNTALEFLGAGTTYQLEKMTTNISGYGIYVSAAGITLDMLGSENNFKSTSNGFYVNSVATLNFYGGKYVNTGKQSTIESRSPNGVEDGFDFILNIYDGEFVHSHTNTSDLYNALICAYNTAGQKQVNISGGTFTSAGRCVIIKLSNDTLDLNISGGTFVATSGNADAIIRYLNNKNGIEVAPVTMGNTTITSSIDITGGTFDMTRVGMPIIYSYTTTAIGTADCPVKINVSKAEIVNGNRLLVARTGGYFDITVSDMKDVVVDSEDFGWVEIEGTVSADVAIDNCEVKAASLVNAKGTGNVYVEIYGGAYTLSNKIVAATTAAEGYLESGSFVVPSVDVIYNGLVDMTVVAGDFLVQKITADTVFDDVNDILDGSEATITTTYFHVLDDGIEHTFTSTDDMLALIDATFMSTLPDYVTIKGVSLEIDGDTKVIFTGGEYTSYTTYFFHVVKGTVVATNATFNAPYGRLVYVDTADASVDLAFTNCNITSGEGYHMFQGSLPEGAVMAKFHLTITGGTYNAGENIASFGAATDAKVIFNSGKFTAGGMILYSGSVGEYAFLGGNYTADGYLFNLVPTNAISGKEYAVVISDVTVNAARLFGGAISDATINLSVKNVNAYLTKTVFSSNETASGTLNVTVENSMFVITREDDTAISFLSGFADLITLTLNGNVTIVTNVDTTLVGDKVIDANAPAVKFAGKLYRAYFSSKTDYEATYEAQLYVGSETDKLGGIRFTTALSDDVVALVKNAVDAQLPVSYGMLIAPADYVIAAGAFTKEALGKLTVPAGKVSYVDVPAVNSKRDANNDGVFESFSAMLINVQEKNYNRAFAAIAYVVVDGEIYYSTFNTLDQARSAKYMAEELIATEFYADDETIMALLNKYAGVAAE